MNKKLKNIYEKTKRELAKHATDSTALVVFSTPIIGALETFAAKMSTESSEHARIFGAQVTYLGMGKLYTSGLDFSRRKFNIKPTDSEIRQQTHDTLYGITYSLAISPLFYLAAGIRDPKQIAIGTLCGAGLSIVAGGPSGYMVDAYRDLIGIEDSVRLPEIIKRRNRAFKVGLAGALAAASIGITSGVYSIANHINRNSTPVSTIEQSTQE